MRRPFKCKSNNAFQKESVWIILQLTTLYFTAFKFVSGQAKYLILFSRSTLQELYLEALWKSLILPVKQMFFLLNTKSSSFMTLCIITMQFFNNFHMGNLPKIFDKFFESVNKKTQSKTRLASTVGHCFIY